MQYLPQEGNWRGLFHFPALDDKEAESVSAPALPIQLSEAMIGISKLIYDGVNLEEWVVHNLAKAGVSVAAQAVSRVFVQETFQDGGGLH